MSEKVPTSQVANGSQPCGFWGVLLVGIGGAFLVRMGYDLGLNQSSKILKRHDKDVRRMDKREKQLIREQKKKEREEKRREEGQTGWFWWLKTSH